MWAEMPMLRYLVSSSSGGAIAWGWAANHLRKIPLRLHRVRLCGYGCAWKGADFLFCCPLIICKAVRRICNDVAVLGQLLHCRRSALGSGHCQGLGNKPSAIIKKRARYMFPPPPPPCIQTDADIVFAVERGMHTHWCFCTKISYSAKQTDHARDSS